MSVARRERNPDRRLAVQGYLESELAGLGEGDVEDEHGARLHIHYAGGRLTEAHGSLAAQELGAGVVDEPDANRVHPYLGAAAPDPQHQMSSRVHGGKPADPDVLEDAEDGQLALLVDQGVIGDDREVDLQLRRPESR